MTDVLATTRCPQCVALVRPGQAWCTLCHADLRPAPEPVPADGQTEERVAAEAAPDLVVEPDPLTAPLAFLTPDSTQVAQVETGGRHARHAAHLPTDDTRQGDEADVAVPSDTEIEAMLAELAAQTGPSLPGVVGRLDSWPAKIGLALGLCLGGITVMFLGAVVVTALFG